MLHQLISVAVGYSCDCRKRKNGVSDVYQPKKKYQKAGLFSDTYKQSLS